jgi:MFS family permease
MSVASNCEFSGGSSSSNDQPAITRTQVTAACIGYALEFYDFTLYTFFAVYIGRTFFPAHDPVISTLLSVATFGIGFIMRPVGSVVIGRIGDNAGRKPALVLTIVLMTVGTICVAATPSYMSIGIAAPLTVIAGRLVQGFALGGEMGPATTMMIELAPPDHRSFYASWLFASQGVATLVAGAISLVLSVTLIPDEMAGWGWRIPFILGLLIIPAGLYIRRQLPETLEHRDRADSNIKQLFRDHWRFLAMSSAAAQCLAVSTYTAYFMTTYALTTLKLPPTTSVSATAVNGVIIIIATLWGGRLADKHGRKPVVVWPRIILLVVAIPLFLLINVKPDAFTLLLVTAVIIGLTMLSTAALFTLIPESLPSAMRSTGLSISIAVTTTVFGGTTQFILIWLLHVTSDPLVPAYYLVITSVIGLIGMLFLPDTLRKQATQVA